MPTARTQTLLLLAPFEVARHKAERFFLSYAEDKNEQWYFTIIGFTRGGSAEIAPLSS